MSHPLFIAEVASNHNRDLNRCLAFVEKAAAIGCDGVKFQLFRVRDLFAPEILSRSSEHRDRVKWELPLEFLPRLSAACRHYELELCMTPFYLEAVEQLVPHVDFFKIASYELLWGELLRACARTGKPLALSTGMANLREVSRGVAEFRGHGGRELTLLHCVSHYPAQPDECHLSSIKTLRTRFNCPVGWSDHSLNPGVLYRAVHRWHADMVEFHLDLDGRGEEYRTGHCWLPHQIEPVIRWVRAGLDADGEGKKAPTPSELAERDWRTDPVDGLRPLRKIRKTWRV